MTVINDDLKRNVGRRLRELRESKGLKIRNVVDELSKSYYCNMDEKSIRRYEKGEFLPKIDNLICFAEFFGTTLDYIIYGKEVSDDNSFTWYDNFKRLNRLLYTMQIKMLRDKENTSDLYLKLLDDEAKEWFGRMERFIENKRLMLNRKGIERAIDIKDLDALFEDFQKDRTQLCPIEERARRQYAYTQSFATTTAKEENGEIVITTKIKKP